jgi:predicted acyltransferase
MLAGKRILTIDIMRGLTLFLMLFVNDLYVDGVPAWFTHRPANFNGMGLADWVFPGFLFMVGMAVPFAIQSRIKKGDSNYKLVYHILVRTISLLIIGVLMLNVNRVNTELTGIPKYLWAILIYICIFLIWNLYGNLKKGYVLALKGAGIAGLIILLIIFKAGTPEEVTWIRTSWWGILGLIGWGYLVTSLAYMVLRDSLIGIVLVWLGFVGINILSQLGLLNFLNFLNPVFGVILGGNVPSIVMAGLFFSLLLRKLSGESRNQFILAGTVLGLLSLAIGFSLRNWFIISKIMGTPSWAMVCNGISILLFVLLFIIIDVLGKKRWTVVLKPAGQNSLTTYLAPNVLYYAIWWSGIPVLIYKQSEQAILVVLGSVLWALLMIGLAALLSKIGIRLKL